MLSADDLQYFLAVARTGRLVRAAQDLGVDHSTVGRRINALERDTGQRLFDRTPEGWHLTPAGQRLVDPAEAVASAVRDANASLGNRTSHLQGNVRILSTDGFGSFILAPRLRKLADEHPQLTIELVTATAQLDHSVRSFDVAVTLGRPNSDRIHARPLADYKLRLYASPNYLRNAPPIETLADLANHDLIWYVDKLLDVNPLRTIPKRIPTEIKIQSTNLVAHWQAAAAGVGIAPMPQFVAAGDDRLVHILPDVEFSARFWLILPKEHARLPRVRAVADLIQQIAAAEAQLLNGPPAPIPSLWRPEADGV
ncbi:LysR family transcriptional regulator [Gordonia hydrophobica]|uniref:LysR family transcriptional regulator n=1 Tax=Gordonia hydrophobica TaxID=40516 RepID=A0ABZ2U680_9ACTN|nr:LysR family transcriptional regulator [Gordonia hydrophobica]MBM7368705.1 DNA-binding transcriptional LysR family regulator [Gordonia hydrophobica]